MRRALVVFTHAPSLDRPNLQKNWHGRQVMLLHKTVLETAALLVGHVRILEKVLRDWLVLIALGPTGSAIAAQSRCCAPALPGRIWKPTRPLGHLGPVVPGAGSAPAPSAWKAVMHLSTPPGQNWWSWTVTLRLVRIASAACCYYHHSPERKWTRRRDLHPR